MSFYGRRTELNKLKSMIDSEESNVSLIYGRRRVGKSELVKQVLRETDIRSIYYECKQTTEMNNVESICEIISENFNIPKPAFNSLEEVLDYMFRKACEEKMILVLDEYPYVRENIKGMDSILQTLVDRYKNISGLSLILLGSYVEVMRELLESANPLFGRIDLIIDLKPMDYFESSLFYQNYSYEDKVRIYSVFGGIPYYNRLIDDKKTVKENIIGLIASDGARLENEVSMYLKSEMSKIVNANEVFEALAKGYSRYKDILSRSHVTSGPTLIDVLEKLMKMEIVEKLAPINDENNRKKAGYYISDNLSLFYYRYIFRHMSQLKIMDAEYFYSRYIEKDFEEFYVPEQFEKICKQYLIRQNRLGLCNPVFEKIGKYYYDNPEEKTNGEFDIVTKDERGYVFYEVKFKKTSIEKEEIEKEIKQIEATGIDCYQYVFFSRSGFDCREWDKVKFIELDELF